MSELQKATKPTLYTIDRVFELHPTMSARGWTVEFITYLVDYDVIGGLYQEPLNQLMIIEESLLAFIAYHDDFLLKREKAIQENLKLMEKNKQIKESNG